MKEGINIIKHTNRNELSGSVDSRYYFDYILSAANRWDGGIIEDFTLSIDFGTFQEFHINSTFFDKIDNWSCKGRSVLDFWNDSLPVYMQANLHCFVEEGPLVFKIKNFVIEGELEIVSYFQYAGLDSFDFRKDPLHYPLDMRAYGIPVDDLSRLIMKNLPFARRGYMFSNSSIQQYYESCLWYLPNLSYKPDLSSLTEDEQQWVLQWIN